MVQILQIQFSYLKKVVCCVGSAEIQVEHVKRLVCCMSKYSKKMSNVSSEGASSERKNIL